MEKIFFEKQNSFLWVSSPWLKKWILSMTQIEIMCDWNLPQIGQNRRFESHTYIHI